MSGLLVYASDVWSFGMLLYHMAAGEAPFTGMHHAQVGRRQVLWSGGCLRGGRRQRSGQQIVQMAAVAQDLQDEHLGRC
jgi:serine/threonine protein kinase